MDTSTCATMATADFKYSDHPHYRKFLINAHLNKLQCPEVSKWPLPRLPAETRILHSNTIAIHCVKNVFMILYIVFFKWVRSTINLYNMCTHIIVRHMK